MPSKLSDHNKAARLNKTKQRMKKKNKPSLSSQDHQYSRNRPHSPTHSTGGNSTMSTSTTGALRPPTSYPYKGFHSSISAIFAKPTNARVDCCAISCCGVFQSDYNRYILFGKRPPTFKNRFVQHVLIPILLFCAAGYVAVYVKDVNANQFACTALLFLCIFWVVGGCLQSTHKRSVTRRDLLRYTKLTEIAKKNANDSDGADLEDLVDMEQNEAEMTSAHRMCGCYPSDDYGIEDREPNADFCSALSRIYSALCCSKLFCCKLQLCGSCALAQEGRQIDAIVPVERRRVDYITFESFMSYFNEIRKLRKEQDGRLWRHYMALSKLSRILIKTLLLVVILLDVVSLVFKPSNFNWGNMIVFMCTFLQAFLVLYFVHWEWNRFDISLDAVIKFFACGFIISTSNAVVFELLESFVLKLIAKLIMVFLPLQATNNGYQSPSDFFGVSVLNPYTVYEPAPMSASSEYKKAFSHKYPFIAIGFLFMNAYFVAALVEEACKYFGFIILEHPDFLTLKQLKKAASHGIPDPSVPQDDRFEWGGGLDCGSGLFCASQESLHYDSFDDDSKNHDDDDDDEEDYHESGTGGGGAGREKHTVKSTVLGGVILKKVELAEAPTRTIQTIGSAITVGMVSVALGFACCENLIYIFLYNGGSLDTEISVLISRSLFPVHPLCAAIQSIGLCRQKLERDSSMSMGWILFPAILLHGSFDFSIMVLDFVTRFHDYDNGNDDHYYNNNSNGSSTLYGLLSLLLCCAFIMLGLCYYFRESNAQNARINQIEGARTFVGIKA